MKTLAIIFFTLTSFSGFAQQGKLSGEITSEGSIVAFANVYIKASDLGTTADKEGKFLLKNIPAGLRNCWKMRLLPDTFTGKGFMIIT